jgi:hypothetical protein
MSFVPTRLLILRRLQAVIETPTHDSPNDTVDLSGGKVFRGRIILGEEIKPLPAVSIVEAPQTDSNASFAGDSSQGRHDMWNLFVQGIVDDDKLNPTDAAYELAATVEQRLSRITSVDRVSGVAVYGNEYHLGGLISDLQIMAPIVRPPEKTVSSSAFFFLPLKVGVPRSADSPYTVI